MLTGVRQSLNIGFLTMIAAEVFLVGSSSCLKCTRTEKPAEKAELMATTKIYAGTDWYDSRPEPEQTWHGVLQKREVAVGPATRAALAYILITEEGEFTVYAARAEDKLAPLVGRRVLAEGKLVNLSNEGYGQELWLASVRLIASEPK